MMSQNKSHQAIEATAESLVQEILVYIRASSAATLRPIASNVLGTHTRASIYRYADGRTPQTKIAGLVGITQPVVSDYLREFVSAGLASPPGKLDPCHRALFTLDELGIDVEKLKSEHQKERKSKSGESGSDTPSEEDGKLSSEEDQPIEG